MGRAPCCDKNNVKKGPWSPEEDAKLKEFMENHGTGGNWIALPQKAGLRRCGKSCRLRWLNYLRPNIKHGEFTEHEDRVICSMYASIGSRWSIIASQLTGRTDNDIKNYWNTKLKRKLLGSSASGAPPPRAPRQQQHHRPILLPYSPSSTHLSHHPNYNSFFTGAAGSSLQLEAQLIPTLTTLPPPHDFMLSNSAGSLNPMTSNASALLHAQGHAIQTHHQLQVKEEGGSSSMIVFGSDQQSCSSSDGTHSHQFGHHGKELSFDGYSYGYSNGIEQEHKLFQQQQQQQQQAQLDYNYEEIKQLLMAASAEGLQHDQAAGSLISSQGKLTMM